MASNLEIYFKIYNYIIDVSGEYIHENEFDLWTHINFGEQGTQWRFFYDYYKQPEIEKYKDIGEGKGIDFLFFKNASDAMWCWIVWK